MTSPPVTANEGRCKPLMEELKKAPLAFVLLCSSRMAVVGLRGAAVATLVLCTWVRSLKCFGLHGLDRNVQDTGLEGRRGKIVFDLEPRLESSSSAAATGKLLNVILGQLTP